MKFWLWFSGDKNQMFRLGCRLLTPNFQFSHVQSSNRFLVSVLMNDEHYAVNATKSIIINSHVYLVIFPFPSNGSFPFTISMYSFLSGVINDDFDCIESKANVLLKYFIIPLESRMVCDLFFFLLESEKKIVQFMICD